MVVTESPFATGEDKFGISQHAQMLHHGEATERGKCLGRWVVVLGPSRSLSRIRLRTGLAKARQSGGARFFRSSFIT